MKYIKLFENFEDSIIKIIDWEDANQAIPINSYFKIIDKEFEISWMMKRTRGKYHADVEPVTAEDTLKMMSCFPKDKSFKEATFRPVIVEIGLEKLGASLMGFPHCGSNQTDFGEITKKLTGGFKNMPNWDSIRDNNVVGHYCLYFNGSIRHTDKKPEPKAQNAIKSFLT